MTEANNNSQQGSNNEVLATIKGTQGRVFVESSDGSKTTAKAGFELSLGDVIHAKGSSAAILDFGSVGLVSLGHDQILTLDEKLMELLKQAEESGSLEDGVNFDLLAQAIEEGRSLEEVLPAAAAGGDPEPSSDGAASSGAIRLELTGQEVTPNAGFETTGLSFASTEQDFPSGSEVDQDFILRANNSQPTTTGLNAIQVDEDVSFTVDLSSAFTDADADQSLNYEIEGLPEGLSYDPATGVITGTPTNDDALNNNGAYTITVTATDNSGADNGSVSTQFDLQVININDAPTIAAPIDLGAIEEDGSIAITVQQLLEGSDDIDLDTLDIASLTVTEGSGTLQQNENGDFTFTPDPDWNGDVAFSYDVIDGNGGVVSNTATLVVTPVNDAPVAVDDGPVSTTTNSAVDIDLLSNDSDVDGDTLTITQVSAESGTVTIGENGIVTYTPNTNFFGDDLISYQISDGNGGFDEASASVAVQYNVGAVAITSVGDAGDSTPVFTGTSSNIVGDLTLSINGNNFVVTPSEDGSWSFELPAEFALADGDYEVSVSGFDDIGNEASAEDQFSIDALMPEVSIVDLDVVNTPNPTFSGTSSNTDGDFTLVVNGNSYTVTPNEDGTWSYTLPAGDELSDGSYTATINASDQASNAASASDDFIVDSDAPSVSIEDLDVVTVALPTFSGTSQNTDGDLTLTVNGVSYPVTPAADGTWSFTLPAGNELSDGSYTATIQGSDNQGNEAAAADAFVIDAVDDMPLVTGEFTGVTMEGDIGDVSQTSGTIDINDPDVGVNPSFEDTSIVGTYGTLVLDSGVWTYTLDQASVQNLDAGDVISETLTLTATDGTEQGIEISITGSEDAPIVSGTFTGSVSEGDIGDIVTATGTITISDVDDGDNPVFADNTYGGTYGSLELVSGAWTYTLDQSSVQELNVGDVVEDAISLTADDGTTQIITISIQGTNDLPLVNEGSASTEENTTLSAQVSTASDIDGSIVSYALESDVAEGSLSFNSDGTFTFDPLNAFDDLAEGETRDVSFTYSAQDDSGAQSLPETFTITVTGTNDLPVASSVTIGSTEENILNSSVPAATDVDGTIASYTLVDNVSDGALTFNADGTYSFDPAGAFDDLAEGETREVSFTYTATDNQGGVSAPATITIQITGGNDLPLVVDASESTEENTVLSASVPAGTDVDGTIASYSLGTDVAEGSLTFNADGTYSFDPGSDFDDLAVGASRDVTFTYTATDDQGGISAPATMTITVTGTNDLPVANAASATTDEETVLSASVPAATDVDGTIASYALGTDVAEGSLTFNADGTYSFDPGADFDDLAVGASRDVTFTYTATDDQGGVSASATVTITVTGTNDLPVASAATETTDEETVLSASVPAATDVDGTIASYSLGNDVADGSLTFNADGTYTFDPGTDFDDLAVGASSDVSFTYTATDDQGGVSAPATVTITVTGTNDLPVASAATETTNEETVLSASVPAASDVDGTIASYALGTDVAEGSLTFNADGTYSFDPGSDFDDLAVGASRDVSFTYTATDDQGGVSAPATVTITVTGTNDLPVTSAATETTDEETVMSASVSAATDVDGTIASYTLGTDVAEGSLTFNADGTYSFDPGADFDDLAVGASRDVSFTYTATDDQGGVSASATVTITVTGTNDLPVASAATATTDEETVLSASVPAATDVDGAIASYALGTDVAEGSLTFNADGTYTFDPGTDFDDLAVGASRDVTFTYTATDDQGGVSAPATVTITVTGTNDLPVASAATETTDEETVLSASVPAASDVDGTIASYSLGTDVTEGSLTFNTDGTYSFDPGSDFDDLAVGASRDVTFTYTATDDQGGVSAPATVTITVTGTNDLPVASAATETTDEETVLSASVPAASDVDGTVANYALGTDVAEGSLTFNTDGTYSFDPGSDFDDLAVGASRDVTFTYTATDDQGGVSAPATVTITVTGTNDLPVASAATETTDEETVLSASVPAASDVDGTIASYALGTDVAEGSLTFNADGTYSFDPGSDFDDLSEGESRDVSFTYTATDDQGGVSAPATVTITVQNTAEASVPVISLGSADEGSASSLTTGSGLLVSRYDDLAFTRDDVAETALNIEQELLESAPSSQTNTYSITDSSVGDGMFDIPADTALQVTGFIFLEAGREYEIVGYRDDTFHIEIGGEVLYDQGFNHWGDFDAESDDLEATSDGFANTAETFTPVVSGFYSIEMTVFNGDGPGDFSAFLSVDGGTAQDFSDFLLYSDADDLAASNLPLGEFIGDFEGGYFAFEWNSGARDSQIQLQTVSASLTDTDGSETLSVSISDIPVGAVLTDGVSSFTAALGATSVVVDSWDLTSLAITPPSGFVGDISLTVSATSTETANGDTATTTEQIDVSVFDIDLEPANDVQIFTNSSSDFSIAADSLAIVNEAADQVLVSGVSGDATYDSGNQEIDVSGAAFEYSLINGYRDESSMGSVSVDTSAGSEISGSSNNDILIDLSGSDAILIGGAGSDYMSGGSGSDTFAWESGDDGDSTNPAVDVISDFTAGAGGDVLDFSDLLQDESADATTLDAYLSFSSDGTDTTISIDRDGSNAVTQEVVLEGIDLTLIGGDQAIIQQLLTDGNLTTD